MVFSHGFSVQQSVKLVLGQVIRLCSFLRKGHDPDKQPPRQLYEGLFTAHASSFVLIEHQDDARPAFRILHEGGFLRHAEKAAADYGLDTRAILVELGRRKMVGGQEDMIVDVALDMLKARNG